MQSIIVEKPYQFIPPHRGTWWSTIIRDWNLQGIWLRRVDGVISYELRGQAYLRQSLDAGHGVLLTPNHCRAGDPLVMGWLAREMRCHVYAMASWHLFNQSRFEAWAIHKMGGFSVYREGVDRQAISTAIEVLETAERPLIVFPEGAVSRTNDQLHALLDGVAFIARTAAKRRQKRNRDSKVVVHPVALKYLFQGDLDSTGDPVLSQIEQRLTWRPRHELPVDQRVARIGLALLALKEQEYLGTTYTDALAQRLSRLIDQILCPLEQEWLGQPQPGPVVPRVKTLRMKILPDMVRGQVSNEERERRWLQLADLYLAQQIANYPPDYLETQTVDRLLETIERFEEDLTDTVRAHQNRHVIIDVGPSIEVRPHRDRKATTDPLMIAIDSQLRTMLARLAKLSRPYRSRPATPPAP